MMQGQRSVSTVLPSNAELSTTCHQYTPTQIVPNPKQSNGSIFVLDGLPTHVSMSCGIHISSEGWTGVQTPRLWTRSAANAAATQTHLDRNDYRNNLQYYHPALPTPQWIQHTDTQTYRYDTMEPCTMGGFDLRIPTPYKWANYSIQILDAMPPETVQCSNHGRYLGSASTQSKSHPNKQCPNIPKN